MNYFYTFLTQPLANGLILFYKVLGGNFGLAIIAFTVFLRLLLSPLTRPYMESMKKMKTFAKDIEKLKSKYKDDKTKFAQAQADFYKEKGINPGGGCLPYVFQFLILIAFFNVFTKTFNAQGDLSNNFNKILYPPLQFKSEEVLNTKFFYLDLTKPDTFRFPQIPFPIPGFFLILSTIFQIASSRAMSPVIEKEKKIAEKTKSGTDDMAVSMQKSMTYTFPLMTILFGLRFPSSLVLYWTAFSIMQFLEQYGAKNFLLNSKNFLFLLKSGEWKK